MTTVFKEYLDKHNYPILIWRSLRYGRCVVELYEVACAKSLEETMDHFDIPSTSEEFYLYEGMVGSHTINHLMNRERARYTHLRKKVYIN